MSYVGSSAAVIPVGFSGVNSQSLNGDGSTVAFTLNRPVSAVNAIEVMVNNVQQSPYDGAYSVSSTTLTFSAAPSSGTANIYVVYRDFPVGSITDTGAVQKTGDTMTGNLIVDANVGVGTSTIGSAGVSLNSAYNIGWTQSAGESVPNIFRQASSAATVVANGYRYTATSNGFASSFSSSFAKSAISLGDGSARFYTDTAATTAAGTDVTPTERMRIDTAGRVTMPYQPAFLARNNESGGTITTVGVIPYQVVVQNTGGHYSTSTNRFTAPVAGSYWIAAQIPADSGVGETWIRKNGTRVVQIQGGRLPTGNTGTYLMACVVTLAANDYVDIYMASGARYGWGADYGYGYFTGYLLG